MYLTDFKKEEPLYSFDPYVFLFALLNSLADIEHSGL